MFGASKTASVATSSTANAGAVDFNGFTDNDYLSSTISISSQQLTISLWIYSTGSTKQVIRSSNNNLKLILGTQVAFTYIVSGSTKLDFSGGEGMPLYTWNHVVISIDTTKTSANSKVFCNDKQISGSWVTYVLNTNIAESNIYVNGFATAASRFDGRLSNVFIKSAYYDLSTTSNRRQFITADRKPADGQAALSPVIYLPMTDSTTVANNSGTGGNFSLNGVVARSGRGPNQYNAYYSTFTSYPNYLQKDSITAIADSKTFTFHCVCKPTSTSTGMLFHIYDYDTGGTVFQIYTSSNRLYIYGQNAGTVVVSAVTSAILTTNRNYVIDISIDTSNSAKRFVYINGEAVTLTWSTYTNLAFSYYGNYTYNIGGQNNGSGSASNSFLGQIGDLWFNTSYIDLSVSTNRAKFVSGTGIDAKPVDLGATGELPTGSTPYIYLPLIGQNNSAFKVTENLGSIGEFSAYGNGFVGSKGPNEFWENKAVFNGTTGYLSASSTSMTASKTFTFVIRFNRTTAKNQYPFSIGGGRFILNWDSLDNLVLAASNSAGTQVLNVSLGTAASTNPCLLLISVDLSSTSLRSVYRSIAVGNPTAFAATWNTYTNDSIDFARVSSTNRTSVGTYYSGSPSTYMAGYVSLLYFSTQYTDFSVEANRLKFIDCFGYATNIPQQITAGVIPNPPIYLRFDPAAFGTNSGTDGNFTVSGTITDGGQL